jgi:hypothetical protein
MIALPIYIKILTNRKKGKEKTDCSANMINPASSG